jgi:hypothetical protein
MNRAAELIGLALRCTTGVLHDSEIAASCLELVARDLLVLFDLYTQTTQLLMRERAASDIFEGWSDEDRARELHRLRQFRSTRYYCGDSSGLCVNMHVRLLYRYEQLAAYIQQARICVDVGNIVVSHKYLRADCCLNICKAFKTTDLKLLPKADHALWSTPSDATEQ